MFVFALADFQTNQLQHLDLRQTYGGGVGYHVIKTDKTTFDVFGGFSYDRDSFGSYTIVNPTPPPPLATCRGLPAEQRGGLVGEEFDSQISKRTMVKELFSFYPNLSHTGQYRLQFDSSVAMQMKTWLSWQTTFSDRYISYPPVGPERQRSGAVDGLPGGLGKDETVTASVI